MSYGGDHLNGVGDDRAVHGDNSDIYELSFDGDHNYCRKDDGRSIGGDNDRGANSDNILCSQF